MHHSRNDMTMNAYSRIAHFVTELCQLPAVATPDWCERVAAAASSLAPGALGAAVIGSIEPGGKVTCVEAAGCFAPKSHAVGVDAGASASVRGKLERLGTLGFRPGEHAATGQLAGRLSNLQPADPSRATGPGDIFDAPGSRTLTAVTHIPGAAPGCVVALYIVIPEAAAPHADEAVIALEAGLPILAKRAAMALGTEPCTNAPWLTAREHEVLEQLILGRSVKQIAEVLGRSPHTVHDHVKSLHRKLNASTRGGLVARALGRADLAAAEAEETTPANGKSKSLSA
jgi:DNA-binding CsgD family transcriptional regulator